MTFREVNFDGLIGPTHNYAGLSLGNVASARNAGAVANPRAAALQGLSKMAALVDLGLVQGLIPPLMRPHCGFLRALGFAGDDRAIIAAAAAQDPALLANVYSASSMWTANAATVAPSPDTADGKVRFTPANLAANLHRSLEAPDTAARLREMFPEPGKFVHNDPAPGGVHFGDEGAANHGRLCRSHGEPGVHLFVYGEPGGKYPARQRRAASEAVARLNRLDPARCLFLQQARAALDAGAFHNDVVGVVNERVVFLHEQSFEDREGALSAISAAAPFAEIIEAPAADVSLADAIGSYLFNSQLLSLPGGEMALLLPAEAEENPRTRAFLERVVAGNNPVNRLIFKDVRESMRNGGGPACLRLRVVLSDEELAAVDRRFLLDPARIARLEAFVSARYRDRLHPDDLADPDFMVEAMETAGDLMNVLAAI